MLLALLLIPGVADAVICKTVDSDGVVSYAEVPAAECSNPVQLPEYSRYAPRVPQPPAAKDDNSVSAQDEPAETFAGYRSIAIAEPGEEGVVRNNEGEVTVVIALDPPLQAGHRIELTIDGQPISGSFDSEAIALSGVERGVHQLGASVIDPNGAALIRAPAVTFTMRQASRLMQKAPRGG